MIRILKNKRKGFALLFAVFTAGILLLIGVSILSISLRELSISQSAKDSQLAFYAADSARECALYWDIKKAAFPYCLENGCEAPSAKKNAGQSSVVCNGNTIDLTSFHPTGNLYTFNISKFFAYGSSTDPFTEIKPMADLILSKTFVPTTGDVNSTISIQGHNTGSSGRRLERGIFQNY